MDWVRAFGGTVAVAAVGLAAGAGCTEEAPSTAQEQAVASGDWIRPNCNGDALTPGGSPTAVQCNGPVTYSYEETWANPACGAPTCSAYNTCTSWDLNAAGDGAGYTVASSSELGATWIYTNTLYGTVGPLPEDVCPSGAADRRAALAATRPGMSAAAAAAFDVTWAVANQQVVSEGGDPQGNDWFQNVAFTCQLDIHNFPTPMTGAHPWCGCAVSVQPTCARTGGTYAATSLPLAIPDNASAGAVATVVAPAGIDLKTVRVSLNVSHPRRADLVVSLISPGGQTAVLSNRVAGNGYVEVGRDVSSAFTAGASAGGVWQLRVQDLVAGNVGTINQLSLELLGARPLVTAVTLAPGSVMPTSPGAPSPDALTRSFHDAPVCQTCDAAVPTTDDAAQAQLACLDRGLATATGDLAASLVARMKLLFQLYGERLTPAQRARVEQLYDTTPAAAPVCAVPLAWDATCTAAAAPLRLPGQVQLCADLARYGKRGIAAVEAGHCIDQLAAIPQLASASCRLATRDATDDAARGAIVTAQPDYAQGIQPGLSPTLPRVHAWWGAAQAAAAGDAGWLGERLGATVRALWSSIEAARLPLPASVTTDAAAVQLLATLADQGLTNDVAALAALYADDQISTSPALLALTGEVLRGLSDRMSRLAPLHDAGCRFAGCRTASALRASALSELTRVIAAIPDAAALSTALNAATRLQAQQPALHAALGALQRHHDRLRTAWSQLGRTDVFAGLALVDPPAEAAVLATIVRAAGRAWASYAATGELSPERRPRLTVAMLEQPTAMAELDRRAGDLTRASATFATQRLGLVNDVLAQIQNQATELSLRTRDQLLQVQLHDVLSRAQGIEGREIASHAEQASFQDAFAATLARLDPASAFQAVSVPAGAPALSVSAAQAHFPIDATSRSLVRDRFFFTSLAPGEALRVRVTGAWSPTCALSKARVVSPITRTPIAIRVPSVALTGPLGYYASFENDGYTAHTSTTDFTQRLDVGASAESCVSTGPDLGGFGAKACLHVNYDIIYASSDSVASSSQHRAAASFTTGIRLPTTPFPEAPVGSLVAVLTPAGDPNTITDLRVVQPEDVIVAPTPRAGAPAGFELHLVVNDAVADCAPSATDQLQLAMVKTTPLGSIAQGLGQAMAATLSALADQAPTLLAEGQLSSAELAALRSAAWQQVVQRLPSGVGLSGLPADLHQLFESFLDQQLASLARRSEQHALELQRDQLVIELAANLDELRLAQQRSQLGFLAPRWRLRDLAGGELGQASESVVQALAAYAAPIFELRDAARYTSFAASIAAQSAALIDLPVTARLEDQVDGLVLFARAVRDAIGAAQLELPDTFRRTIVVAFPRPPTNTVPSPVAPPWHSVSPAVAAAFWQSAADANGAPTASARIRLNPRDLYVWGGESASLACSAQSSDDAPVVRHVAAYLDTLALVSGSLGIEAPARAAQTADVEFPRATGSVVIAPDDPHGVPLSVPVLAGPSAAALDAFAAAGGTSASLGAGAGLSPFTSFDLNLSALATPALRPLWDKAQALYLVLEIERRVTLAPTQVEGVCVLR